MLHPKRAEGAYNPPVTHSPSGKNFNPAGPGGGTDDVGKVQRDLVTQRTGHTPSGGNTTLGEQKGPSGVDVRDEAKGGARAGDQK